MEKSQPSYTRSFEPTDTVNKRRSDLSELMKDLSLTQIFNKFFDETVLDHIIEHKKIIRWTKEPTYF